MASVPAVLNQFCLRKRRTSVPWDAKGATTGEHGIAVALIASVVIIAVTT